MLMESVNSDGMPADLLSSSANSPRICTSQSKRSHKRNDSLLFSKSIDKHRLLDEADDEQNIEKLLQLEGNSGNLMDNLAQLDVKPAKKPAQTLPLNKSPFLNETHNSKVLLIEDDLMNIEAMRRLLLQFNLELSWATSGSVALEMLQLRLDRTKDPDPAYMYSLILCDYSMPGMNGLQCSKEIR